MRRATSLLFVCAALMSAIAFAAPARSETAKEFAIKLAQNIQRLHAQTDNSPDERLARCHEFMASVLALDIMARAAAADIWERMNANQRRTFRSAFETRMGTYCVRALSQYDGQPIAVAGVRRAGEREELATVRVGLTNGNERLMTWRLRNIGGRLRVVDLVRDGRGLVASEASRYVGFLESNNNNIDALIASLTQ